MVVWVVGPSLRRPPSLEVAAAAAAAHAVVSGVDSAVVTVAATVEASVVVDAEEDSVVGVVGLVAAIGLAVHETTLVEVTAAAVAASAEASGQFTISYSQRHSTNNSSSEDAVEAASDTKVAADSAVRTTAPTTTAEDLQAADLAVVPEGPADLVVTVLQAADPVDLVGMAALLVVGSAEVEDSVGTSSAKVVLVGSTTATPSVRATSAPFSLFFFSCCRTRPLDLCFRSAPGACGLFTFCVCVPLLLHHLRKYCISPCTSPPLSQAQVIAEASMYKIAIVSASWFLGRW